MRYFPPALSSYILTLRPQEVHVHQGRGHQRPQKRAGESCDAACAFAAMEDIIRKPVFWGLDPLFHTYVKLLAGMLSGMVPGEWGDGDSVYFYSFVPGYPRPVRLVSIAGVVVFVSKHQKVKTNWFRGALQRSSKYCCPSTGIRDQGIF